MLMEDLEKNLHNELLHLGKPPRIVRWLNFPSEPGATTRGDAALGCPKSQQSGRTLEVHARVLFPLS